jgi:hypothetical protein
MIEFVYSSRAVKPFTHDELLNLLAKSRTNNESLGIRECCCTKKAILCRFWKVIRRRCMR